MKFMSLLLVMTSFLLASCDPASEKPQKQEDSTDRIVDPVCNENSKNCDMTWIVTYKKEHFPKTILIYVNKKLIFNECLDTHYGVVRGNTLAEITMWSYKRLLPKNVTKFSFMIKNVSDCNDLDSAVVFDENNPQYYTIDQETNRAFLEN